MSPNVFFFGGVVLLEHRVEVQVHSALGHVSLQGRSLDHNLGWVVRFEVLEAEQLLTCIGLDDNGRYGSSWIVTVSQVVSCTLYQSDQWKIPSYGRFFPIKITIWFRDLLSGKHPKN